jgi:hypothetical protein
MKRNLLILLLSFTATFAYAQKQQHVLKPIKVWAYWGSDSNIVLSYFELKYGDYATLTLVNNTGVASSIIYEQLNNKKNTKKLKKFEYAHFKPFMIIELSTSNPGVIKTFSWFIDKNGVFYKSKRKGYYQIKEDVFTEILERTQISNFYKPNVE